MMRRLAAALFALSMTALAAGLAWSAWTAGGPGAPTAGPSMPASPPDARSAPVGCGADARWADAAARNAASLATAPWSVFGREELGWEIYAPLAAHEIGAACPPDSPGFARALADWQHGHGLAATGAMDVDTLDALRLVWLRRRPFVAATAHGDCPAPPAADRLAVARPEESYGGKTIELRAPALEAYRAMRAAARREDPRIAADPAMLAIFSGYRDPAGDGERCAQGAACGTVMRANCSAHRTGLAVDLYLGAAPGYPPDSSEDANRLRQSRTPAFLWMAANAGRFGFVSYPFEPWHWEWTGEAP